MSTPPSHPASSTPSSVTELALLTLPPSTFNDPLPPPLLAALSRAKAAMQRVSGQPFTYVRSTRDPQAVFIVGGWPSVRFHMEEWIPSAENQALVEELGELGVGVRWMWHVGVERGLVRRVGFGDGEGRERRVRIWRGGVAGVEGDGGTRLVGLKAVSGLRVDDGFLAEGEKKKSLKNEEEGIEEVVVFARLDEEAGVLDELDRVLGQAQSLAERWEVDDGVVLNV